MSFSALKPGDKVTRLISSAKIPMEMIVVKVEDGLIYCNTFNQGNLVVIDGQYWTFDLETGAEVDEHLKWGPAHGITGSFLSLPDSEE